MTDETACDDTGDCRLACYGCAADAQSQSEAKIAFARNSGAHSRVFTINPDGGEEVRVSQLKGWGGDPDISALGTELAYVRNGSIYVAGLNGDGRRLLVNKGGDPAWSPSGDRLLFTRYRSDGDVAMFSVNADGSDRTELTDGPINYQHAWAPDGSRIAFIRDAGLPRLWVMNSDGSGAMRPSKAQGKEDGVPDWSPDGSRIVFIRMRSYTPGCLYATDIVTTLVDGGGATNLTKTCDLREGSPRWSPDGSKIVYTSPTSNGAQIFVMNADGTDKRQLTDGPGRNDSPVWSPDGARIAFISKRDGNRELYVMNADGTAQTRLTRSRGAEFHPAW